MIQATDNACAETSSSLLTRTALLVEDEPLVAMLTEDNLRDLGFEPLWVGSAAEALQALQTDAAIALAVIDVGLPDMRGDDLAVQVRRDHPELGVVLATGHDPAALRARFAGDGRIVVLGKPYLAEDLARSADAVAND